MKILTISNLLLAAALVTASAQTPARPQPGTVAPSAPPQTNVAPAPRPMQPPSLTAAMISPNTVVLTIGDQKFTRAEFEALVAMLPDQLKAAAQGPNKRKFVEQFAELESLAGEARRRKLDESAEVKQMAALQMDQLLANELYKNVNATTQIDDAQLRAYYDQHKSEFEEVKASHILVRFKGSPVPLKSGQKELTDEEALAKAKDIRAKLLAGADFATLAKTESDDSGSGANGGSLGTFGHGRMVKVFEDAAFSLPVGQVSEPVKSQFGYHIIKVDERTEKKFEDVKPQIEARLKPEMTRKALDDLRKSIPITIDDQYFGTAAAAPAPHAAPPAPQSK